MANEISVYSVFSTTEAQVNSCWLKCSLLRWENPIQTDAYL